MSFKGKFLVATPSLGDPNFTRAVVLICDHTKEGAMGLVVNRPLAVPLSQVLPEEFLPKGFSGTLFQGGPVQPDHLLLLHGIDHKGLNRHAVCEGTFLGGDLEVLKRVLSEASAPPLLRCFLGYAGWAPGQLEEELGQGAWVTRPARPQEVFGTDTETLWARLIGTQAGARPDPFGRAQGPELN